MQNKPLNVVYIDDDVDDRYIFQLAFQQARSDSHITLLPNSENTIQQLRSNNPQYDLVFIDLNMPVLSGIDILERLRNTIEQNQLRIVVLTTSGSYSNIRTTFDLGATLYVQKPYNFRLFVKMISTVTERALTMTRPQSIAEFVYQQ